jgi:protein-arginine kinase activator protein McsA
MNIYCIKCKSKTNTLNIERIQNVKNRNIIKGICEICKSKKSEFEKSNIIYNEEKLNNIYYSTKTGYSGINDIARKAEENVKSVKTYLESQNVYTLHKPARKKFKRRKIYVYRIDEQWQADLVDVFS